MQVKHQTAKRCTQLVRDLVVGHAAENQVNFEVRRKIVEGEILTVEAHVGEEVQLVPVVVEDGNVAGDIQLGTTTQVRNRFEILLKKEIRFKKNKFFLCLISRGCFKKNLTTVLSQNDAVQLISGKFNIFLEIMVE